MVKVEIRRNAYYDSVTLMIISKEVEKLPGINEALVGMGTELNCEIARKNGLANEDLETVGSNDFFVAAACESVEAFAAAVAKVDEMLEKKSSKCKSDYFPPTLDGALKVRPDLNMAIVSVPGRYAAEVAQSCLERDINVMLFSDNVAIEEEKALKEYAAANELLVMGPDCGTAIVNHVPLAFANVVREGDIGMVCASGTGAQEVSSIIDQLGGGISQLLGTGGRDLRKEVGGTMMKLCLNALANDSKTRVIAIVSKPPTPEVACRVLDQASACGKPVVVCFIGGDPAEIEKRGLVAACSLEDCARKAVALSRGEEPHTFDGFAMGEEQARELAESEASQMAPGQKYVRGLYTGGTLCDEAMKLLIGDLGHIRSNIPLNQEDYLADARTADSVENTFLDFGDDAFTVGRPHPMIDPSLRAERVAKEAEDPEVAVVLVDCVIGYGSHEDPAADLSKAIRAGRASAEGSGRHLTVVASVCGTDGDPQGRRATQSKLEEAGAIVLPTNAQAARFAQMVLDRL